MSNSEPRRLLAAGAWTLIAWGAWSLPAQGQQAAQGFAVERFYPSAAGGGWFVMDDLDMHGGFGGALSLTLGYARDPLDLTAGGQHLVVVADQAFADIGLAVTYDRFRLYADFSSPITIDGTSGALGGYQLTAPNVTLGNDPDTLSDPRFGFDVRLVGQPGGAFRLGASAQLYIPSGAVADYDTDGTFRAMFRLLVAGDVGPWRYAAQLGVHVRPVEGSPIPGGPDGSELLLGVAGGRSFALGTHWSAIVGPEIFGESAFDNFLGGPTTGLEALLTGRFEGTGAGAQPRFKIGVGAGIDPNFGVPEWRLLLSAELFSGQTENPTPVAESH